MSSDKDIFEIIGSEARYMEYNYYYFKSEKRDTEDDDLFEKCGWTT